MRRVGQNLGHAARVARRMVDMLRSSRADRRELNRMLGKLAPGDVVTVTRIDRLARSTFDLFGIVKRIVDAKAQFRSLAEPWADSSSSTGRLMLAVLGGLADVERDLIRTRTAEGRSRAKAQGKHMGRPPSLTPAQQKEATRRRARQAEQRPYNLQMPANQDFHHNHYVAEWYQRRFMLPGYGKYWYLDLNPEQIAQHAHKATHRGALPMC